MNYANLLIILIVLIIIYLIYNHYGLRESFSLESNLNILDASIVRNLNKLAADINNNQNFITTDNLLYDLYGMDTINKINDTNEYVNTSIASMNGDIETTKNKINVLNAQLKNAKLPDTIYQSIKSLQNGIELNVQHLDKNKYIVNLNSKCLRADGTGNYKLEECNSSDDGQIFTINDIYTDTYYNAILEPGLDSSIITSADKINYPFSVLKSKANGNCLQNNHGSISIEPCQIKKSQRWKGLNHPIICK